MLGNVFLRQPTTGKVVGGPITTNVEDDTDEDYFGFQPRRSTRGRKKLMAVLHLVS